MRAIVLSWLLVFACAPLAWGQVHSAPAVIGTTTEAQLDAYIARAMDEWDQLGLSIVVVKDGQPVYMKGFGTRSMGGAPVDVDTKFGMMSTTKAMTALAVAMLVDEGKLAWDDPVQKTLPWFQMPDPAFSRMVTVRDTLRHNAGLGGDADLLWESGYYTKRSLLERVSALTPAYTPYSAFGYSNVMYQVAGELVTAASGMEWEQFIEQRIMAPLKMTRSHATLEAMMKVADSNISLAHFKVDGKLRQIRETPVDAAPAAGAAWSTARDAARWMQFLLDEGQVDGKPLVSELNFRELFKPQVIAPATFYPTTRLTQPRWTTYGLGWFQQDYRGEFLAMHTGSLDGRTAIIGLVPERELGVFVFGNVDHVELRHALMFKVIDLDLGGPSRDWSAELRTLYAGLEQEARQAREERARKRIADTRPSRPLAAYAGVYTHPAFGDLKLALERGRLVASLGARPEMTGPLAHWHYETFDWTLGDGRHPSISARFDFDDHGEISAIVADGSIRFVRAAKVAPD